MPKRDANISSTTVSLKALECLQEVPMSLFAELDRCKISVRELLDLREGTLLPLSRPTGENINIYAGNVLLGSGEILVIDSSLGVRVAEIREKTTGVASEQLDAGTAKSQF